MFRSLGQSLASLCSRRRRILGVAAVAVLVGACLSEEAIVWEVADEVASEEKLGSSQRPIVRGNAVVAHPTAGALQINGSSGGSMICSGTLIGCDTFLTAAHCVCSGLEGDPCGEPTPAEELSVFFQHAGTYEVEAVATHEDFDFPQADIAVLRLKESVRGIRPAPLQLENPALDAVMTIVGFGMTFKNGPDVGLKREGVLQRTECSRQDDELMLCFEPEESPTVSCNGDSGGPNYLSVDGVEYVAGVVAGGGTSDSCQSRQKFATQVAAHLDFVYEHAGELGQERCGDIAQAEDGNGRVEFAHGVGNNQLYSVEVPPGTAELRIGANGVRGSFLDLAVSHLTYPDFVLDRCAEGFMSAHCTIDSPKPGRYLILVRNDAEHQVAMTTLAGGPIAASDAFDISVEKTLRRGASRGLLANDQPGRGLELRAELLSEPSQGTVVVDADGSFVYTPAADAWGGDQFRYRVIEEGKGAQYSAEGEVTIRIVDGDDVDLGCSTSGQGGFGGLGAFLAGLCAAFRRRQRRRLGS